MILLTSRMEDHWETWILSLRHQNGARRCKWISRSAASPRRYAQALERLGPTAPYMDHMAKALSGAALSCHLCPPHFHDESKAGQNPGHHWSGWKTIRGIQRMRCQDQHRNTGIVTIASADEASLQRAKTSAGLTEEVEVGRLQGTVRKIRDSAPSSRYARQRWMVHISQLAHHRVNGSRRSGRGDQIL